MNQKNNDYATALFSLSKEKGNEEAVYNSLKTVSKVFSENPEYIDFLATPSISKKERVSSLEKAFSDAVEEDVIAFVGILCENGKIRDFFQCENEYEELFRVSRMTSVAEVVSAVPLNDEEKEKLKAKLEKLCGKEVLLSCRVDNSLIGGIIVNIDGKVIDGSVKRRLNEIKEVINR